MTLPACPTEQELVAFAIGRLSTQSLERIERHVEGCMTCQASMDHLDTADDELLLRLAETTDTRIANRLRTPEPVLASARAAVAGVPGADRPEVSLDSGRHYARLLQDGPCRLGRFELLSELGVGSFGYVFRARDLELDRTVAIKVQRAGAFASEEEVGRFLREARSTASLTHPAIVSLFDTGHSEDGVCFLVTEYVEGETLQERLKRERVEFREAAALLAQLAEAVEYAHDHGIVHADMMEQTNEYYSDLLTRLDTRDIVVTHEYATRRNALPLPATFTIDSAQRMSQGDSGLQFRLYSQYPFRANGGPKDDFQREALKILTDRSRQPPLPKQLEYHRFVTIDGRPSLKYARGQLMKESCVKCHNAHQQSPKKDWKENELVGVLLIARPLDRDVERTQAGLQSAFVVMGSAVLSLTGFAILAAMRSRSRVA